MQKRHNSIAKHLELHLFSINYANVVQSQFCHLCYSLYRCEVVGFSHLTCLDVDGNQLHVVPLNAAPTSPEAKVAFRATTLQVRPRQYVNYTPRNEV